MTSPRCRPGRCGLLAADDSGFAMVTAVIVSALIVAVTGALVLSLTSGGRESARQRELYEARAAGVSALEYLYAELGDDADFFDGMLAASSPDTYDWIELSSATSPDTGTDSDWNQFGNDLTISACTTRTDPCWALRFKGDGIRTPLEVVVEAIVRFDCRGSGYCSVKRFQQRMTHFQQRMMPSEANPPHEWTRSDLTEVTETGAVPPVSLLPPPAKTTGLQVSGITPNAATVTWTAPTTGPPPTSYHIQWKSGTEAYPTTATGPRHREATTTSHDFTMLTHSTTYTVRVRTIGRSGDGPWSDDFSFTTQSLSPNSPMSLRWASSVRAGSVYGVTLEWAAPVGPQDLDSYLLQWKSGIQSYETSGSRTQTVAAGTTEAVVALVDGSYRFRVLAKNSVGFSRPSGEVPVTVGVP